MLYKKMVELTKPVTKSRIKLVGMELEGGWLDYPAGMIHTIGHTGQTPPGVFVGDGSLYTLRARRPDVPIVAELPSPPMIEADVDKWLRHHWPQVVGPECGFHVHMSFVNPLVYMRLMDDESYPGTVITYLKRWAEKEGIPKTHPLWSRLEGKSVYCQHVFQPDDQVKNTVKDHDQARKGHRYTALNYCYNREMGTIECRVLPMFESVEHGIGAVKEILSVTNRYLVATAKIDRPVVSRLDVNDDVQAEYMSVSV